VYAYLDEDQHRRDWCREAGFDRLKVVMRCSLRTTARVSHDLRGCAGYTQVARDRPPAVSQRKLIKTWPIETSRPIMSQALKSRLSRSNSRSWTMVETEEQRGRFTKHWLVVGAAAFGALAVLCLVRDPQHARALALAVVYLVLALSETVAPFVPTLFLLAAIPLALGPLSSKCQLSTVLAWAAGPVIALFAAGFALGLAAERHGVDKAFASRLVQGSRG
jgi:hypothetical protein